MIEKIYNIHNMIKFKIVAERFSGRLDIEYKNFECNHSDDFDFIISIGDFIPSNDDCIIADKTYYIKKNYFYCKDSHKFGSWKIELLGLEEHNMKVNISTNTVGNYAADMFICAFLIDFLIRFKMEQKGYSMVHSSAVSKDGKAYLFPSHSGAGKTTTAVYFTKEGYQFLGDDFVILDRGDVFSYLTPLNIFAYNLRPFIKNFGFLDKQILGLKNLIYSATAGNIKIFTKLNPADIFKGKVCEKSKLNGIFLLVASEDFCKERVSREKVLNNLYINQKLESFPFIKYIEEYGYVFPESSAAKYWDKCQANLIKNIGDNANFFSLRIPKVYNDDIFECVKGAVECQK